MLTYLPTDLFDSPAQTLVNPVNMVRVMDDRQARFVRRTIVGSIDEVEYIEIMSGSKTCLCQTKLT